MTGLWIAVGMALMGGGLYALARIGRTTITPYTAEIEQDESWLSGDFEATRRAGYVESLDDYADRIARRIAADPDAAYKAIQAERQRLNARQGDPQ